VTEVSISERRLASGAVANVLRIDVRDFEVLPLFLRLSSPAESRISQVLGEARLAVGLGPVPPAHVRLAEPEHRTLERVGRVLCLAERTRPAGTALRPTAPLHLLRLAAADLQTGALLINANYFLFQAPELEGPWNACGDPIGLTLANGQIETPPQMRRACLVAGAAGPVIRRFGFADLEIAAAGRLFVPHAYGPPRNKESGVAFAVFHGSASEKTPAAQGTWDVAFVGRHSVALKPDGGMPIPRAGCVLRCGSQAEAEEILQEPVTYRLGDFTMGVQAGPIIVEDGRVTEAGRDVFAEEAFSADIDRPDRVPVSPHAWSADWRSTRAARLSAGLSEEGALFFCAVEGTSSFFHDTESAKGATLRDLAVLMREEGARTALHLDGGGSTQVFGPAGSSFLEPRDVFHGFPHPQAQIDRPLPLALKLT